MEKETIEEAAKENCEYHKDSLRQYDKHFIEAFKDGAKWQAERMSSEIEEKWLEYRNITNNEDAWCFKEWLVNEFKK